MSLIWWNWKKERNKIRFVRRLDKEHARRSKKKRERKEKGEEKVELKTIGGDAIKKNRSDTYSKREVESERFLWISFSSLWPLPSGKTTCLIETRTSGPRKLVITRETAFNYQIFLEYLIDNLITSGWRFLPPYSLLRNLEEGKKIIGGLWKIFLVMYAKLY